MLSCFPFPRPPPSDPCSSCRTRTPDVVQAWSQAQRQSPSQQGERCPASISRTKSRTSAGTAPFIIFCHLICNYLNILPRHLQALEMRVSELEEENSCLRAALNLPPANRAPLGKGPTGKDKPKSLDNQPLTQPASKSGDSSPIADSPSPRRSQSTSPPLMGASLRTPPMMDNHWDEGFMMNEQQSTPHISSTPAYNLRPLPPTSVPQKSPHQFTFSGSTSRSVMPNSSISSSYQHTTDRPMASGYNDMNYLLCDVRDNPSTHYSYHYQQSPFSGESSLPAQSPQVPVHSQSSPTTSRPSLPPAISFQPRRSHHEPTSFRPLASDLHLPSPVPHHSARLTSPSSPALHDVRSHYPSHSKVNPLP